MATEDFTIGMKTERMTDIALAFKKTCALLGAIELELFSHIAGGAGTTEELGAAMGIEPEKADRLLTVCKALDLVREVDGRYRNMSDVERYLVKDSRTYFGDYLIYIARRDYPDYDTIAEDLTAVADGQDRDERSYLNYLQDPEEARRFTVAGYEASIGLGHKLAKEYDFSRFGRWLDIAGGSGCYAIAACERHPELRVTVFDQPNVIVIAQEFITKHGLEARIDTTAGNFLETPFPEGHDLASYITPLQGYMPDEIIAVLRRTQEALKPGGEILILDYMLEDDKTGPLDPAFVNLAGVRRGRYLGRVNTGAEWCDFLGQAGYVNATSRWFTPHQLGLITAQKPG
ncbi:MAG: methyltransferase [Alphaproteobacteria bacterium]|nr:methyltransferase [Alphaproteobacteria bacterium]MDP6565292.1 methyltransferase [Alphaproteobacteria bacterium]MDP6812339.1 methyltransferase [Alphaproteobacteria bacterium]